MPHNPGLDLIVNAVLLALAFGLVKALASGSVLVLLAVALAGAGVGLAAVRTLRKVLRWLE